MHAIIYWQVASPIDSCLTENYQQKLLGRCKNIKFLSLEVVRSQTRNSSGFQKGAGLMTLEFGGHGWGRARAFWNFQKQEGDSNVHATCGMVGIFSGIAH